MTAMELAPGFTTEEWYERMEQSEYNLGSFLNRFFMNRRRRREGKPPLRVQRKTRA